MTKMWALLDNYKTDKSVGLARFAVKQIDYSRQTEQPKELICVDKTKGNIERSRKLLLKCWEDIEMPKTKNNEKKGPLNALQGHSRKDTVC